MAAPHLPIGGENEDEWEEQVDFERVQMMCPPQAQMEALPESRSDGFSTLPLHRTSNTFTSMSTFERRYTGP